MTLQPGARIGRYEAVALHGSGGMGEVYLGRDERLDRRVAIKVLSRPATPRQVERFQREARAISRVTHPHICSIFDVGEQDGLAYLIMEFLEGDTLASRLEHEPLPLERALAVGAQIADALAAGHQQGIVHRDVTPGNVMLTASGAKLLDFGLAMLQPVDGDPAAVATTSGTEMTDRVSGTLPYMAPEQVEGGDADARTDVFALGVVLYEMLTGRRPFQGRTSASLAGAIIAGRPAPVSSLVPGAPAAVDRVIEKCLAKNPDDRWQTARDLASELRWCGEQLRGHPRRALRPAGLIVPRWAVWSGAAVLTVALVAAAVTAWGRSTSRPLDAVRLTVPAPDGYLMGTGQIPNLAIAPDGSRIVFASGGRLYLRALDRFEVEPIPGTENGSFPFFSPDGEWLGFTSGGLMMKVPVSGGPPVKITESGSAQGGAAWGPGDRIVFARGLGNSGLWAVSASGGPATQITTVSEAARESQHMWPDVLPDGAVLYTALGPSGHSHDARLVIQEQGSQHRTVVAEGVTFGRYVPTGHLLYVDAAGTLLLQPFDLARRAPAGPARGVLGGVRMSNWGGAATYAISATGTLAFVDGTELTRNVLEERGLTGEVKRRFGAPGVFDYQTVSPDGRTMAVMVRSANNDDIFLVDIASGRFDRFSFGAAEEETPLWSPDGRRVAYSAAGVGEQRHIFVKDVAGGAPEQRVHTGKGHSHLHSWSPDGRWIAFSESAPRSSDAWLLDMHEPSRLVPVATTSANESRPVFSPDGRWLAYLSNETGRNELYVVSFPELGAKQMVSQAGASLPQWSPTGADLYFISPAPSRLMRASRGGGPGGFAWTVAPMFEVPATQFFTAARDGRSFYFVTINPDGPAREIRVITNWLGEVLPPSSRLSDR